MQRDQGAIKKGVVTMQLSCIHCGQAFSITTDQLGGEGNCPHCGGVIRLPKAGEEQEEAAPVAAEPTHWWQNSISGLVSVVFHMVLFVVLALIGYNSYSGEGLGEDVLIGELPSEKLGESSDEQLSAEEATAEAAEDSFEDVLEVDPPVAATESFEMAELAIPSPSSSGGSAGAIDFGTITTGGGSMGGGSWDGLLQNLRRNGLDIVITFDSTGSMGGEISQVTEQISRIGSTLLKMVPKARIGLCTYRDQGEEYVARGLPLTSDINAIQRFLAGVQADGGGDFPEAVHEGLQWAVQENQFRSGARNIVLLFGDAPPHSEYYDECLRVASDFQRQYKGVVSTVTCRQSTQLPAFREIAEVGGGEAFLTTDERQIMTQLMVLVFGSSHRGKVVEAFKLMER